MRRCPVDPHRPRTAPLRTDGGGVGLFTVTERPVIEHTTETETPVVRRVNAAFTDTFGITDAVAEVPLSTTLASVTTSTDAEREILENARDGTEAVVQCKGETAGGTRSFDVRTVRTEARGYVIFTEAATDDRIDVLKYLTHSLRNPLEVATVHTDVMAESETLEHLETVRTAHERMDNIIEDTMALAQQGIDTGDSEAVEIAAIAREAWATARTDAATLDIGTPGTVRASERRLAVLFENLFRNAVRHGTADGVDPEGDLTVIVDGTDDGFYVADDGSGIPTDDRDRVLNAGFTTEDDGTGLGLAIVAEIAGSHGWEIAVTESEAGGTRFEFSGPASG